MAPATEASFNSLTAPAAFLEMQPTATAIYDTALVTPDSGAFLKTRGQNINDGEFRIKAGNVSAPTEIILVKLSKTSNTYHLLPFDTALPEGVGITLHYDHSAMPIGVLADDLQVFRLTASDTIALESQVKQNHMEVKAHSNVTGEFSLGAYDVSGKLHMIEGEFGIRKEDWIQPRKGGTIRLGGGSQLTIPKNALDERTLIGIIAERATIKQFTFTPHGTVFNTPIELVLSWREMAGQNITLYYFNELTGEWEISAEGVWDENNQTVTLLLHHFSRYALSHG